MRTLTSLKPGSDLLRAAQTHTCRVRDSESSGGWTRGGLCSDMTGLLGWPRHYAGRVTLGKVRDPLCGRRLGRRMGRMASSPVVPQGTGLRGPRSSDTRQDQAATSFLPVTQRFLFQKKNAP